MPHKQLKLIEIKPQYLLNVVLMAAVAYLLTLVWNQPDKESNLTLGEDADTDWSQGPVVTSVWCHHGNNKLCQFENLCYNSEEDEFVMFKDESSIAEHAKVTDGSLILDLSSVQDHNAMQTTVISLPSRYSEKFNTSWVEQRSLVFKRFLPDNLMHLFHDDILPLHDILRYLTFRSCGSRSCKSRRSMLDKFDVQLVVFDDTEEELEEEIETFYEIFSKFPIKFKKSLRVENGLTCFRDVTLGLSSRTIWYEYGFKSPQGPLSEIQLKSEHVVSTVNFLVYHLDGLFDIQKTAGCIVLFTRKENRRILNEVELTLGLARKTGLWVVNLSLETHSLVEIISYVKQCRGIIGMHGSLLMLSLFLRPYSFVVEMFPYAINPVHYTPYKTFCHSSGRNFVYKAWTNKNKENTVGHPDWLPEMGGIKHLEKEKREIILSETEVPQHRCCSDPSWLYHIYQDTVVDIAEVTALVHSSLEQLDIIQTETRHLQNQWDVVRPSKIKGVRCKFIQFVPTPRLLVTFTPPWTILITENIPVTYEILIQNLSSGDQSAITHKTNRESFTMMVDQVEVYAVWVRGVANDVLNGPYSDSVYCTRDDEQIIT